LVTPIEPKRLKAQEAVVLHAFLPARLRKISEISQNFLGISSFAIVTLLSHRTGNCKKIAARREGRGSQKGGKVMHHTRLTIRVATGITALIVSFATPASLSAQGVLENPQTGSFHSGLGVVSGWVCNADRVDLIIDEGATLQVAYGTDRGDTQAKCGDTNNGFGLLLNWNLLGDGTHTIRALADGVQFGSATFTVTTLLGNEFLRGVEGSCRLSGFPYPITDVLLRWEESLQNFVIERVEVNEPGGGIGP
jgi:hypothetical protein